jgi:hypothetical protein
MTATRARLLFALVLAGGCGQSLVATRPTEPVTAHSTSTGLSAALDRVLVTDGVRAHGMDDGARLVVELRVKNEGAVARRLSPGSFSCTMELDATRPEQTRALLPAGGGEGKFHGVPDEGTVLAGVTIPPGEERAVWAIFEGYRFEGSGAPRRITLTVPLEGGGALAVVIADPARGGLRWESRPARGALVVGLRDANLFGALEGTAISTELTWMWRAGRLRFDAGMLTTTFVAPHARLQSETSAFSGLGLTGHVAAPLLSWGPEHALRQLGVYAGGSASVLIEIPRRTPDEKSPLHTYGLYQAEAGLELAAGQLRLAPSPFPLTVSGPALPRWAFRLGYVQSWADGATVGGFATTLRFLW